MPPPVGFDAVPQVRRLVVAFRLVCRMIYEAALFSGL